MERYDEGIKDLFLAPNLKLLSDLESVYKHNDSIMRDKYFKCVNIMSVNNYLGCSFCSSAFNVIQFLCFLAPFVLLP